MTTCRCGKGAVVALAMAMVAMGLSPQAAAGGCTVSNPVTKLLFSGDDTDKGVVVDLGRKAANSQSVCIVGHSDDRGDIAYNRKLAIRRVRWVAETMISAGVPRENVAADLIVVHTTEKQKADRTVEVTYERN